VCATAPPFNGGGLRVLNACTGYRKGIERGRLRDKSVMHHLCATDMRLGELCFSHTPFRRNVIIRSTSDLWVLKF
jgi:hypothetical protein